MRTIADVQAANESAGYNWFDKDTMRFWHTKIESTLIQDRYFITSEQKWDGMNNRTGRDSGARVYAVREAQPDGSIKTLASYLTTRKEAKDYIAGNCGKKER